MSNKHSKLKKHGAATPYIMMLPYLLLILSFPICVYNILIQSFGIVPGVSSSHLSLGVLANAFNDSRITTGIVLSLYIAFASTIPALIFGTIFAWVIVTLKQETILGGIIAKLPQLIPQAVGCVVIVNMFLPSGLLARGLMALGFENASNWFMQILYFPNSIGVILEYIWKEGPFVTFMLLPSMSGISDSYGEAAQNLGASTLRTFLTVTLPNCMPVIRTCAIIIFVITLGSYETPALLGSPVTKAMPAIAYDFYGASNMAVNRPISMVLNLAMMVIAFVFSLAYYTYGVKKKKKRRGRY